jgi:hypothetical protein
MTNATATATRIINIPIMLIFPDPFLSWRLAGLAHAGILAGRPMPVFNLALHHGSDLAGDWLTVNAKSGD